MPEIPAPAARDDAGPVIGRRVLGAGLAGLAATLLPGLARASRRDRHQPTTPAGTVPDQGSTPPEGDDGRRHAGHGDRRARQDRRPTRPTQSTRPPGSDHHDGAAASPDRRGRRDPRLHAAARARRCVELYDTALGRRRARRHRTHGVLHDPRDHTRRTGRPLALLGQDGAERSDADRASRRSASSTSARVRDGDRRRRARGRGDPPRHARRHRSASSRRPTARRLLASIVTIGARHCVVLAELAGRTGLDALEIPEADALRWRKADDDERRSTGSPPLAEPLDDAAARRRVRSSPLPRDRWRERRDGGAHRRVRRGHRRDAGIARVGNAPSTTALPAATSTTSCCCAPRRRSSTRSSTCTTRCSTATASSTRSTRQYFTAVRATTTRRHAETFEELTVETRR